jgi:TonB-linked SusC/RagA family outer membrane protein
MRKFMLLVAFLVSIGMQVVNSQTTITGMITDETGQPFPGVNINAKGTTIGALSDLDGAYTLDLPDEAKILVFSFVGYKSKEVEVGNQTVINVSLEIEYQGIDQVVVTALGIQREKKKLGYSVSTVEDADLNKGTSSNLTKSLSGKVAGVQVSGGVGAPGSSTNVVLRGYANIGRSSQPLYVIDGVPVNNAAQSFSTGGIDVNRTVDFGNGINDINSMDVESISILRGASATALYGSQAANGVVMITTKSGTKKQKPNVNFSSSSIFSSVLKFPDFQKKWGQGWDGNFNSKENGSWGPLLTDEPQLWGNEINGQQLYKNFSFLEDQLRDFYDVGNTFDNSISISGGGEVATYYVSYNYVTSDGVVPKDRDGFDKHSFKLKSTMKVGRVSASASVNYIYNKTSSISTGQGQGGSDNLFNDLLQHPTDISLVDMKDYYDPNSFFNVNNYFSPYLTNPYFVIENTDNTAKIDRFIGNTSLTIDLVKSIRLKATIRIGGDISNTFGYSYDGKFTLDPLSVNKGGHNDIIGYYREFQNNEQQYNIDGIISGGADLLGGDLIFDANIGFNVFNHSRNFADESVTGLIFEQSFPHLSNSTASPDVSQSFKDKKRLMGIYASAELGFKSYLFLTLTARNDWSSTLPESNNTYFYPSASIGFIVTDAFEAIKNLSFLDYFKIRIGYGLSGNDAPPYRITPSYAQGGVYAGISFSDLTFPLAGITGYEYGNILGNPNLSPEISSDFETGIEMRFLKNRIGIDATYYNKLTDGLILERTVASSSGYTGMYDNIGEILNEGVELSTNLTPIRTDNLRWDITYTYAKNNNKVLSLTEGLDEVFVSGFTSPSVVAMAGKTVSQIKGTGMQLTPDGLIIVDPQTGRPLDSQAGVDLGSTLPDYTMGLSSRITYKGFEFSFLFDYRKGGLFVSYSKNYAQWSGKDPTTTYNDRRPFVVPNSVYINEEGDYIENTNPITKVDLNNYYGGNWNDKSTILDKTFLKLREVNLTYNIPSKILAKTFIQSASISLIGNNLLLFTPVENNIVDPEISTTGNSSATEFGEIAGYPSVRSYGFRLNINL